MTARCIMVLGTTSGAGKSWLATALCRHYARRGLSVAPFKAQNMSNNARVVATETGHGEIGSAQYLQALAARVRPAVDMNPVLLKPEADMKSQVVVLGQVDRALSATPWRERGPRLWPVVTAALDRLRAAHDVVILEGAGSPTEINLMDNDIVNLPMGRHADARHLLVTDIDRGGAFAHLYGTWAFMPPEDRARLAGFVLNRFRGDAALLAPGPAMLEERTGVPVVATLPMWWRHGLPEEDAVFAQYRASGATVTTRVAILAWPRISNLDEFQPLANVPGMALTWARTPAECLAADLLILPGSKHTSADLLWMRAQGLDRAVVRHAEAGKRVLGICGGLQMLGEALIDVHDIDGNGPGLGVLPLVSQFAVEKTVRPAQARFAALPGAWAALSGIEINGYEIRHGQTAQHAGLAAQGKLAHVALPGLGWRNEAGNVLGITLHGLFENTAVLRALFGADTPDLDTVFDGLADFIQEHFAPGLLERLVAA